MSEFFVYIKHLKMLLLMILCIEKVTYYVLSQWNSKDIGAHSYC